MIEKIIDYSARNRVIVLMLFGLIIAWGGWAVYKTPVDAIPDLSDNQVIVFTDYPGRSPRWWRTRSPIPWRSTCKACPRCGRYGHRQPSASP